MLTSAVDAQVIRAKRGQARARGRAKLTQRGQVAVADANNEPTP